MRYKKYDVLMSWDNIAQIMLLSDENRNGRATVQILQNGWWTNTISKYLYLDDY